MSGKQIMNDNSNQSKRMQMLTLIILLCTRVGETELSYCPDKLMHYAHPL